MGSDQKTIDQWILSSDIGCDFIFMDGVVHACGSARYCTESPMKVLSIQSNLMINSDTLPPKTVYHLLDTVISIPEKCKIQVLFNP